MKLSIRPQRADATLERNGHPGRIKLQGSVTNHSGRRLLTGFNNAALIA